jgi:hypothetical protein
MESGRFNTNVGNRLFFNPRPSASEEPRAIASRFAKTGTCTWQQAGLAWQYVESGMGIENVINRFFGHVNGRTSGATIQSVRVLSRHPPIDCQPHLSF